MKTITTTLILFLFSIACHCQPSVVNESMDSVSIRYQTFNVNINDIPVYWTSMFYNDGDITADQKIFAGASCELKIKKLEERIKQLELIVLGRCEYTGPKRMVK